MDKAIWKSTWVYLLLFLAGFLFLTPFLIMVAGAATGMRVPIGNPLTWLFKEEFSLASFSYIFVHAPFLRWVMNSLIITVIPVAFNMFFSAVLGYIFARKLFPFRDAIFLDYDGCHYVTEPIADHSKVHYV